MLFLYRTKKSPLIYIIKASYTALLIALIISILLTTILGTAPDGPNYKITMLDIAGVTFFAPLIETILMLPVIWLVRKFIEKVLIVSIVNALFFSILHSLSYPLWGLTTFTTFVILSTAYQVWEIKSFKLAFSITMGIHALINGTLMFLIWITELL